MIEVAPVWLRSGNSGLTVGTARASLPLPLPRSGAGARFSAYKPPGARPASLATPALQTPQGKASRKGCPDLPRVQTWPRLSGNARRQARTGRDGGMAEPVDAAAGRQVDFACIPLARGSKP